MTKQSMLQYVLVLLIMLAGCGSDAQSKKWAKQTLAGKPPMVFIKGFVELGYTENRGMVFGIMNNEKGSVFKNVLTWVRFAIFIAVTIVIYAWRRRPVMALLPFLLIWAGAIGNLIDQLSRGYVVDFIHLHAGEVLYWPFLFNLADAYLCIGMALLIAGSLFGQKEKRKCVIAS
jgi:signal peptidase II